MATESELQQLIDQRNYLFNRCRDLEAELIAWRDECCGATPMRRSTLCYTCETIEYLLENAGRRQ